MMSQIYPYEYARSVMSMQESLAEQELKLFHRLKNAGKNLISKFWRYMVDSGVITEDGKLV